MGMLDTLVYVAGVGLLYWRLAVALVEWSRGGPT